MRAPTAIAALLLSTTLYGQQAQPSTATTPAAPAQGVSTPPPAIDGAPEPVALPVAAPALKPRIAPAAPVAESDETPLPAPRSSTAMPVPSTMSVYSAPVHAVDPDGEIITEKNLVTDSPTVPRPPADPAPVNRHADGMVVMAKPDNAPANELPEGTQMRVRLEGSLSTQTATVGTPFQATLLTPVERMGRVYIPAGSTLTGRVTEVRSGRRIAGAAALHLNPQLVTFPDGTQMDLHAALLDTDQYQEVRVNGEGTLVRQDHVARTLAAMSLTTGSAAAAGAVFGGGVGAVVGAGIGAGLSAAWWLKQDRQAGLPEGSTLIFGLTAPIVFAHSTAAADMPHLAGAGR